MITRQTNIVIGRCSRESSCSSLIHPQSVLNTSCSVLNSRDKLMERHYVYPWLFTGIARKVLETVSQCPVGHNRFVPRDYLRACGTVKLYIVATVDTTNNSENVVQLYRGHVLKHYSENGHRRAPALSYIKVRTYRVLILRLPPANLVWK